MKSDFSVHEGTFLLYPFRSDVWRKNAAPIAASVMSLCKLLAEFEPVTLGVQSDVNIDDIKKCCGKTKVHTMSYNDIWIRDSGAVPSGGSLVKFGFNAWGGDEGLYGDWKCDETVPMQMSELLGIQLRNSSLTLEGGNLLTNGNGTLISIKSTIYNDNRNPGFAPETIEEQLKQALDLEKIIWIEQGLKFDETGGHIDNLCAFADEKTIMLSWTDDPLNPQYDIVHKAFRTLETERGAKGEKFNIIKIPLPETFERTEDDCEGLEFIPGSKERLIGEIIQPSYINFIFANGIVVVPSFDDPADSVVRNIFSEIFPDRKIIMFPAREIMLGGGGLHCITKNY